MSIDTFNNDKSRAIALRNTYIARLYNFLSLDSKWVPMDGNHPLTEELQFKQVDAVCASPQTGKPTYMEEKYDFHQPTNFCLETESNTTITPVREGWMITAQSDRLVYSFVWIKDILDVYLINFPELRQWFWREIDKHKKDDWREWIVPDTFNHSRSYLVPIKQVFGQVPMHRYLITLQGSIIPIHPLASAHEILSFHGLTMEVIA